jgi:hypothetical protein
MDEHKKIVNDRNIFGLEESWKEFPIEIVEVLFSQAEQDLQYTVEVSRAVTDKAYMIIGIILTFILGGIGFIFSVLYRNGKLEVPDGGTLLIVAATSFTVVWLTILVMKLRDVITKRELRSTGTLPSKLISDYWISLNVKEHSHKWLLFVLCDGYQARIKHNEEQNEKRVETVSKVIDSLIILPFIVMLLLLFLSLFGGLVTKFLPLTI